MENQKVQNQAFLKIFIELTLGTGKKADIQNQMNENIILIKLLIN